MPVALDPVALDPVVLDPVGACSLSLLEVPWLGDNTWTQLLIETNNSA